MNVFKVNVRHNTEILGQGKNEEELRANLALFLTQLDNAEVLSVEDLGDAEKFFDSVEAEEYAPIPTGAPPTIN